MKMTAPTPVNSHAAAYIMQGRCEDHNVMPPGSVPVYAASAFRRTASRPGTAAVSQVRKGPGSDFR
jgi:hypothetical protein